MRAVGEAEAYFGDARTLVGMVHLSYEFKLLQSHFQCHLQAQLAA